MRASTGGCRQAYLDHRLPCEHLQHLIPAIDCDSGRAARHGHSITAVIHLLGAVNSRLSMPSQSKLGLVACASHRLDWSVASRLLTRARQCPSVRAPQPSPQQTASQAGPATPQPSLERPEKVSPVGIAATSTTEATLR